MIGYGTVDGAPVAFTTQRAAAGVEILASLAVRQLNRGEIGGPDEFVTAVENVAFTGHWFYVDDSHIAYALAGRHPVRAAGVTTEFPSWGTGEWEWAGFMAPSANPSSIDPASGCLHSWNNKVAPGWHTADDDWGNYGPHRVDLLIDSVCGRSDLTLADVVAAHTMAGSQDLRGTAIVPVVLELLSDSPAPTPRLDAVRQMLDRWVADGATRRDVNRDWYYDDPAVGVVDAFFPALVDEVFGPIYGDALRELPLRIDAGARTASSSFGYGWYGVVASDLERAMGLPDDYARLPVACGHGVLTSCRASLWSALDRASTTVAAQQLPWNTAEPANWRTPTLQNGKIPFLPIVFNPVLMQWSNRPAYEQAIEFR